MTGIDIHEKSSSPFHAGEIMLQKRAAKHQAMEGVGRRFIRSFMPDQHREFFEKLPFLIVGSVDQEGWPWASIVYGEPGFISTPSPTIMNVSANMIPSDPLRASINPQTRLGLLGIELHTRRRNRMNGYLSQVHENNIEVTVDQSFGNCPQYIQTRPLTYLRDAKNHSQQFSHKPFTKLDSKTHALIANVDTFFVASHALNDNDPEMHGVDVSHRGGKPGFIKVEGDTLTIPDFPGNYFFNTLGNFVVNPKGGLLFIDFEKGDVVMLSGRVEILSDDDVEVRGFKGAERAWRFTLDHGHYFSDALPFRSQLEGYSPNTLITGDWKEAAATVVAEAKREEWRPFKITNIVDESSVIRSFYLEPMDGGGKLPYEAGQHLTVRVQDADAGKHIIRNYTLSSAPSDAFYRISVKSELYGKVSSHLHENIGVGDIIDVKAPRGDFFIDASIRRPAVLLGAGVGITPMISMAQHVLDQGVLTRFTRPLTIIQVARSTEERAFSEVFRKLEKQSENQITYYSIIRNPVSNDRVGIDFDGTERITSNLFRQILALDDYDFYLCGPANFMQSVYDELRELGIRDTRIYSEAFGPATFQRQSDDEKTVETQKEEANEVTINFAKSAFEQRWNKGDGTILEIAEEHGLTPEYGCRNGVCGTCAVKINKGQVTYRTQPSAAHSSDEALICCAVPAKDTEVLEIDL